MAPSAVELVLDVDPWPFFFLQPQAVSQSFCVSFAKTTKNRKMKRPWNELKITNKKLKAVPAPRTVNAPKSQVSPKRIMTPKRLSIVRIAPFLRLDFSVLLNFLVLCLTMTTSTKIKTIRLKIMMARMGPRKAAKNTMEWLMKQLW